MFWLRKGIVDEIVTSRKYSKIIINEYDGDIERFLIERFPNLFWQIRGYGWLDIDADNHFNKIIKDIFSDQKAVLTIEEAYNLYRLVKQTENVNSDIAEVGVFKGGSAKVICEVKGKRMLHLFDTFEGMPAVKKGIDVVKSGSFSSTDLENVKAYLAKYENVLFYKGLFPASAKDLRGLTFSFVNLDVDIYSSTLACLEFFYPRMEKGGIVLSHDYRNRKTPGVKKAFDEFFADKAETIIELWASQCMIQKN